jgi:cytochrome c5
MRFKFAIFGVAMSMKVCATEDANRQQLVERIKPIGQVRLAEQEMAGAMSVKPVQEKLNGKQTNPAGQATYEQYCSTCHREGVAGAPRFRVAADWQPRLAEKTLAELVASAVKGLNAMPAKGTCVDCSETDLKNAIQYMLPQP